MIKTYYPTTKDIYLSKKENHLFKKRGVDATEWARRDTICSNTAKLCTYKVGDVVNDNTNELVRVTGIVSNYLDYGDETEWPKNDNPFIVCTVSLSGKAQVSFCTYNYVRPIKTSVESTC